jgi:hypothetical protein
MSDERGVHSHGPEQVGGDHGRQHLVVERFTEVIAEHDPGVVDHDVQVRVRGDHFGHHARDADRIADVKHHGPHAGVSRRDRAHRGRPAPGDDDLVASPVQFLGQAAPDAGRPAGDQDRVAGEFRRLPFRRKAFRRKASC